MATQTDKDYPFPEDTDPADVPFDVQALAQAIDASPGIASLTQTEIDALDAGEKWAGRIVWNETTEHLQVSNGSAFANCEPTYSLSSSTPAAVSGVASPGIATTVSRDDHVHAVSSNLMTLGQWTQNTNPTMGAFSIGNGSVLERYARFGRVVVAHLQVKLGSTSVVSGVFSWTPTIPADPDATRPYGCNGQAFAYDYGLPDYRYTAVVELDYNDTEFYFTDTNDSAGGEYWNNSRPFTWTTNDQFSASIIYEAAS